MGLRGPGSRKRKDTAPAKKRRLPWLKRGLSRAERVIAFLEFLPITKGILAGQRMKLLPNQAEFVETVYGRLAGDGRRIIRTAIKSEPRGNGKTGLIAGLCLCHLLGPEAEARGEVYSAAIDKKQASLLFAEMAAIIDAVPEFDDRCNVQRFHKIIEVLEGDGKGSIYEALSADVRRGHGLAPSLWVYDEYAQVKTSELFDNLQTAQGKRKESLGIVISTQAATDQHPLSILIDDAARGNDPSTYLQITAAPGDCDPFDEELWKAINPAWGIFLDEGEFRAQAERARRVPSFLARFCNLRLNMRIEAEQRFLSAPDWRACGADIDPESLRGKRCYLGLDLSSVNDLTALAGFFPDTGDLLAWFWKPAEGLDESERADHVPYKTWVRQGFIETTPGRAIDKSFVVHRLGAIAALYDVQGVAFDRWGMAEVQRIMADEGLKLEMVPWGQGWQDMGPSLDAVEKLVLQAELRHPKNPVLDMCVANAVATMNAAGARKLDKARATGRIDGLQAAAMAIGLAARTPPKRKSVYASRGVLTLDVNAA
ncbi:terminase large subunit [Sinorhizobium meliloti]|uniref:terminase large subunit n=1 Tax=Rhizobium meliloti TaxID=382 RepID=UPI0004023600|nr:terminase TerL endonuclease subunit [Sinorhizobium meliloti]